MPKITFPSKWLKANINVEAGDIITFLDAGKLDKDGQWVFNVKVQRTGEEKLFSLNKKNFVAISKIYGENSDKWVDKTMKVRIGTAENPRTGEEVDTVRLMAPDGSKSEDEANEEMAGQDVNPDEVPFS